MVDVHVFAAKEKGRKLCSFFPLRFRYAFRYDRLPVTGIVPLCFLYNHIRYAVSLS